MDNYIHDMQKKLNSDRIMCLWVVTQANLKKRSFEKKRLKINCLN